MSNSLWPVNQCLALNLWKAQSQRNGENESAEEEPGENGIRHYKCGKQEKNATKMIIYKLKQEIPETKRRCLPCTCLFMAKVNYRYLELES